MELFRNLFPTTDVWEGNRIAATDGFNFIGENLWDNQRGFFINNVVDEERQEFADWSDVFGPEKPINDNVTSLLRYDFSDPFTAHTNGFFLTGFNTSEPTPEQPFAKEDIVIVTDGFCSSTCNTFTSIAMAEGVRTIALGGRPINAPMQAIGGVKGGQALRFGNLADMMQLALSSSDTDELPESLLAQGYGALLDVAPPLLPETSSTAGINYRNAYSRNDTTTPLQFTYEAANCKLFYTPETVYNIEASWEAVAEVAFRGGKCVPGSTVNDDDTIGDVIPPLNLDLVKSTVPVYDGPGSLKYNGNGGWGTGNKDNKTTPMGMVEMKRDLSAYDAERKARLLDRLPEPAKTGPMLWE
jgi:hypothetical protein